MFDFLDIADEAVFGEGRQMMTAKALREQMAQAGMAPPPQQPPQQQPPPQPPAGPPQGPQGAAPPMPPPPQAPAPGGAPAPAGGLPMAAGRAPADLYAQAGEIRKRAYGLEPDPKVMEEERYKAQQNVGYGSAISALGTERMRPTGGAVLQQALRRQGELEMDPEKDVARKVRSLEAEAAALDRQAATAVAAEDRQLAREAAAQARADANDLKREGMALRRDIAGMAAGARGEAKSDRQQQAIWRTEDTLRDDFNQVTKPTRDVLDMARNVGSFPADGRLSPIQQQSLIILLNKFQDPGSVVREGEFDRVAAAQGLLQKWGNLPAKITSGQPLPPALVKDIQSVIKTYQTAAENTMRQHGTDYGRVATSRGADPARVIPDVRWRGGDKPAEGERGRGTADSPLVYRPGAAKPKDDEPIKVDY